MSADPDFPSLQSACCRLGLELTEEHFDCLVRYAALLRDWNARINLISRRDTERVLSYHVLDSLAVHSLIPQDARVCDVGTGAGLPGIPLTLVRPDVRMFLIESSKKKGLFLQAAITALAPGNTELLIERAESLSPLGCDVALSRLTGPVRATLRCVASHLKPGGRLVLFKHSAAAEELPTPLLARLGLEFEAAQDITLPLSGVRRRSSP
jgi:16S rRNA (guanine527-N7)-methyltransferase